MARTRNELSSIDFHQLIGGPLSAVVKAQAEAARTTVEFIQSVGFKGGQGGGGNQGEAKEGLEWGEVRSATFQYKRVNDDGQPVDATVTVPLLTMLPIPYIRVDNTDIEFNAKITDVVTSESTLSVGVDTSASGGYSFPLSPWKAEFKATMSTKYDSKSRSTFNSEYQMNVKVHAVQDEMPAGLTRLLGILEKSVLPVGEGKDQTQ